MDTRAERARALLPARRPGPLAGLTLLALLAAGWTCAEPAQRPPGAPAGPPPWFDQVTARAKALSDRPFEPPTSNLPEALARMSYSQYRAIRFRPERALWRNESLFEIQLFHAGFLYNHPVSINTVRDGVAQPVQFTSDLFSYDAEAAPLANSAGDTRLGFAGFRVHYPLNSAEYKDEVAVFLGASYFRLVGPGQVFGLSARGLAVNTALPTGEEFPEFREFWLEQPTPDATTLVFYALLDSPSVAGAYRFELEPGAHTTLTVEARLFLRADIAKLGIAPLTSMFHHGEAPLRFVDDFRPEVHDSDGLLLGTAAGEWIWRPLSNPNALRVTALGDNNPRGFGLLQRDREFDHYLDLESHYQRRPSLWVEPLFGDFGEGHVEQVEIPSPSEIHDNMVAYWVPKHPPKAGDSRAWRYRLRTFDDNPPGFELARVERTQIGWGAVSGSPDQPPRSKRIFAVDFHGGELARLGTKVPVQAELTSSSGTLADLTVSRLPGARGWRASFKLSPEAEQPADLRLHLTLRGQRLSETWSYVWYPDAIE